MNKKALLTTMYNRNFGVLTVNVSTLGIANVSAKPKINAY